MRTSDSLSIVLQHQQLLESIVQNHEVFQLLRLSISGMEVTQGIQYYDAEKHLTDASDRGPDNSLRLVAGKPAWVRVYVRSMIGNLAKVTGTLEVYRRSHTVLWKKIATLDPVLPGTVTAKPFPVYATTRGTIGETLNFVVPADDMCGHLRFVAKLSSPGGYSATREEQVDVTLRQTLSMRIVPVAYDGVDALGNPLTIAAPTVATAQNTAAWSTTVYPVESTPAISLAPGVTLTFPLTGNPGNAGGCAQSWLDLNQLVAQAQVADGNLPNTFYYGLVPAGVPLGFNSGCASAGVTSGTANGAVTMAHEFGHALGFQHAPCGGVGASADPNYPAYEPHDPAATPTASIGEYGLDINNGNIKNPATFKDFMGYCGSRWISIYNHARSIEHPMLSPSTVCEDQFWKEDWREYDPWWWLKHPFRVREDIPIEQWVDPRESVISVIGVMQVGGHFEPRSVTRARAVPGNEAATSTGAYVELLDDDGTRIAAGALLRLPSHGHGCGGGCGGGCREDDGPALVQAFIPTSARGSQLRLTTKDGEAWSLRAPEKPIAPARFDVDVRDQTLALRWTVDERHPDCEVWIRCATGKGEPRVIWVAKGAGEVVLEFGVLPPGPARIDLVCHDGFDAVSGEPVEIEIPARAPQAAILYPTPGRALLAGRPLRLHGLGTACDGSLVEAKACRWLLDGTVVSEGRDVWTEAPPAGKHELTFEVRDRHGSSRASCRFETVEVPRTEP